MTGEARTYASALGFPGYSRTEQDCLLILTNSAHKGELAAAGFNSTTYSRFP